MGFSVVGAVAQQHAVAAVPADGDAIDEEQRGVRHSQAALFLEDHGRHFRPNPSTAAPATNNQITAGSGTASGEKEIEAMMFQELKPSVSYCVVNLSSTVCPAKPEMSPMTSARLSHDSGWPVS